MDFIDQVRLLSQKVSKTKGSIQTEEATKMSLVVPFFQMLGYDVFNPQEFLPEFTADVGIKKGEKVDYAVILDGKPSILIEVKWSGTSLDKHDSQLFRYFSTTTAKFAVLTNGVIYKFYTDLEATNKMDLVPFLEIDLLNLKDHLIPELKRFCKDSFNSDELLNIAAELRYSRLIKEHFSSELRNPTEEFVRFFLTKVYNDGLKTKSIIDKYTPVVKKSLNDYITELMNEKITNALSTASSDQTEQNTTGEASIPTKNISENRISTTTEELEAFYIVKGIICKYIPSERITYKDTENYLSVIVDGMVTRWICRFALDGKKKYLVIPGAEKDVQKIQIQRLDDIFLNQDQLITSAQRFVKQ